MDHENSFDTLRQPFTRASLPYTGQPTLAIVGTGIVTVVGLALTLFVYLGDSGRILLFVGGLSLIVSYAALINLIRSTSRSVVPG